VVELLRTFLLDGMLSHILSLVPTTFGVGQQAAVVPKYHNAVFKRAGDEVLAENDADDTEDVRFSKLRFCSLN